MKKLLYLLLLAFILLNIITCNHTYRFSHFSKKESTKKIVSENFSMAKKLKVGLLGMEVPKRKNLPKPNERFKTVKFKSDMQLDGWYTATDSAKGTVLLFHGYAASKSTLTGHAMIFQELGYHTLLVDFRGAGDSEGHYTTIGHEEARDVKAAFDYAKGMDGGAVFVYGVSMGAAAVLKAMQDYNLDVDGLILECPFASMRQALVNRFEMFGLPSFPVVEMMMMYGSIQQGFNIYNHAPSEFAKAVEVPVLMMYGEKDKRVRRFEIDAVFENLKGPKQLKTWPNAVHDSYLIQYRSEWKNVVMHYLDGILEAN